MELPNIGHIGSSGSHIQTQLISDDAEKIPLDAVFEEAASTVSMHINTIVNYYYYYYLFFAGAYIHAHRSEHKGELWRN